MKKKCSASFWSTILVIGIITLVQILHITQSNRFHDPRVVLSDQQLQTVQQSRTAGMPAAAPSPVPAPLRNATNNSNNYNAMLRDPQGASMKNVPRSAKKESTAAQLAGSSSKKRATSSSVFYSVARTDRSGATINDMLLALAYGHARNMTYGGACYVKPMTFNGPQRQAEKLELIRALGLQDVLIFACPENKTEIVDPNKYKSQRDTLFSTEFIDWLRSQVQYPAVPHGGAVVHIRRGDVDPCNKWKDRYLPSSYYLEVLKRHVPPGVPVTIFSESASFEPWDDFLRLDHKLQLDSDVAELWRAVLTAKYVVLSVSSFATLPAVLNANATVVYPPSWMAIPVSNWISVEESILARGRRSRKELAATRCHNYTSVRSGRSSWNESRR